MADKEEIQPAEEDQDELDLNYKIPDQKSIQEIKDLDKDDESLVKYKQNLLGDVPAQVDRSVPNVQVLRLTLVCNEAPAPITMDLTGDLVALKKQSFVLKEGVCYRIKVTFKVNWEIVCGLRYIQQTYRKSIKVDKGTHMVGSYGPRSEEYEFLTPAEEAPKGMLVRGLYHMACFFTDDDKTDHLSWEWNLCIKKDWQD